jgi:hypothetical protein
MAIGLVLAGLWAQRDEGDALGTVVGVTAALNVNIAPVAAVNESERECDAATPLAESVDAARAPPAPTVVVVDAGVEYAELARHALGSPCPAGVPTCTNHWDTLTGDQQGEISALVVRVAVQSAERQRRSGYVQRFVRSSAGDHPLIDIVTEGSSLAKNLYLQFHRMLTTPDQGYPFVVKKLEARLARP